MITRSTTKTVAIDALPERVFDFLADVRNWPQWAVVNVKSIGQRLGDWWEMLTPQGQAKIRIRANESLGILDHDFHSPEAQWTVPARIVPCGDGSLFMITFFQPPSFTDKAFDEQTALVDKELARLKEILEIK